MRRLCSFLRSLPFTSDPLHPETRQALTEDYKELAELRDTVVTLTLERDLLAQENTRLRIRLARGGHPSTWTQEGDT